ncbi:DNA methyltransferase [Streptomyces sp. NPDC050732]|uniref:DNA methyltransferase n=1 Tax=Streptomyces sp. NPDC050732 TaxID=3154632 RepID=UPI0034414D76
MLSEDQDPSGSSKTSTSSLQLALPLVGPASGRGRSHGTSNNKPFDRWFRYPAGFASDYVAMLLSQLDIQPSSLIVDPFTGSGVTGTAALTAGHSFFGVEAHPEIAELASLKLAQSPVPAAEFMAFARQLAASASARAGAGNLKVEDEPDLVRRCFTVQTLGILMALREVIKEEYPHPCAVYAKWALLGTLRDVASAKVGWPYQRPGSERKPRFIDPVPRFIQRVTWMAEDLYLAETLDGRAFVATGDARNPAAWASAEPGAAHGCISSPPYLNNFDYADATRLELYFWGVAATWAEMCSAVRSDMLTATTQQSSVGSARKAENFLDRFGATGNRILDITSRLEAERTSRKRGKEYDRVVPDYFQAIALVLENLSGTLMSGAPTAWLIGDSAPYGVYIDTPALIGEIAERLNFTVEKDVTLRLRGQRWATNTTRHDVQLSERLLLLRRR